MKTNLLSCFILSFIILSFSSCNPKKALEDKVNETIAEEIAGAAMGTDVETSNMTNADKAKAEVDVKLNGTSIGFENSMPNFIITKSNDGKLSFLCTLTEKTENENLHRTLNISYHGQKTLFTLPLTATITTRDEENKIKASFFITNLSEKGIEMKNTNAGTVKLISFSDEEVVFEIDAKGEEMNESKTPFSLVGKIVCKNPIMTFMGLKKDEIFN